VGSGRQTYLPAAIAVPGQAFPRIACRLTVTGNPFLPLTGSAEWGASVVDPLASIVAIK
jgi:hypothetical protein